MGYRFKGRGVLYRNDVPVWWWPLNWLWFVVIDVQQRRRWERKEREAKGRAPDGGSGTP